MPDLILVKHSLPEFDHRVTAHEWYLSAEGRLRSQILADRLTTYAPEIVFASTEPKAIETAQIVANQLSLPLEIADGLQEQARKTVRFESAERFEANMARFFENPQDLVFGEETADQAHQRFSTALEGLLAQQMGRRLVVVAHGTVITLFVSRTCGIEPFPMWKRLGLPSFVVLSLPGLELREIVAKV